MDDTTTILDGYKCPVCDFTARSEKVVAMHLKQAHPEHKQQTETKRPKLAGVPLSRVQVFLRSGQTITGAVEAVRRYEIVIKPDNQRTRKIIFKHAINYIDILGGA
ncbi:MAG: RNA chaperone Hfq [Deltaproteobacteria bacterium]|nr:RNA chaperone Hfq [Deltaproteobacteria bacterium]